MSPSCDESSTPVTVTVWAHVPVGGGEGQAGRRDGAFGRVAGRQADRHVGRRAGCSSTTVNVAVPPASVVVSPAWSPTRDPGRVVVQVGHGHVGRIQAVVVRIGAGGGPGHDRVGHAPSCDASSSPVTVTVCAMFQLAAVNVRLLGETVPSVVSLTDKGDRHVGGRCRIQDDAERRRCRPRW